MSQVTAAQRSPLAPILSQGKAEKAPGRGNGTFRIWSPFLCLTTCPTVLLQVHCLAASLQDSSTSTPKISPNIGTGSLKDKQSPPGGEPHRQPCISHCWTPLLRRHKTSSPLPHLPQRVFQQSLPWKLFFK